MRALPEELDPGGLTAPLADCWEFHVETAEYAAVGGGSYHWVVTDPDGRRGFVTVDDLDRKPWFGDERDSVFDGLRDAFETAVTLRDAGLEFVVAPIPTSQGEALRRLGPRYTVALFPFVDGDVGRFGQYDAAERAAILTMLAEIHRATPAVGSIARRIDLELPGRRRLDAALEESDGPWSGGPLSEPAREALAGRPSYVTELLASYDRLSAAVATSTDWVITHGEPHAANVLRTGERHVLVDWDTVGLAPPERDLWMLADHGAEMTAYAKATGHEPEQAGIDFFRLRWDLSDIAAFTEVLRGPHRHSADMQRAYDGLTHYATKHAR